MVDTCEGTHLQEQRTRLAIQRPEPAPAHGDTIKTDRWITGAKIYSDAAWKTNKILGSSTKTGTGIGVFCHIPGDQTITNVFVQASIPMAPSPLQAEASALLLAATIAKLLQLQQVTFLTDNSSLAKAAASRTLSSTQVQWKIRQHVAKYFQITHQLQPAIYHISRNLNGISHSCAQQAVRQDLSQPIFSCINSAHANMPCPMSVALQDLIAQGFVIHLVSCS